MDLRNGGIADGSNLLGAILFFSYIVAALALTGTIIRDIVVAHKAKEKGTGPEKRRSPVVYVLVCRILLALTSFSTLSYHMLMFLIDSRSAWSSANNLTIPAFTWRDRSLLDVSEHINRLHIWQWATSSTLFRDFAEAICTPPIHYWWTQKALLYSYAWNWYMAREGMLIRLPADWATRLTVFRGSSPGSSTLGLFRT
jgi:hypothetical protein